MDVVPVRTAIVSVSDKSGLTGFAAEVLKMGVEILATGGTYTALREAGLAVRSLQDDLKLPTAVSGRVKTLHAPLHAAILAKGTPEDMGEVRAMGAKPVDMVVCNFYPFAEALKKEGAGSESLVESIDIGGPTMVRGASKNFARVLVVPSPAFYPRVLGELKANGGGSTMKFRREMAVEAFSMTAAYDAGIFNGLRGQGLPSRLLLSASRFEEARYGENPDTKATIYSSDGYITMTGWRQLAGDKMSFNNYLDAGSAYDLVSGYPDAAAVATVKHGQISGFAFAPTVAEAYRLAHSCDPEADFGGTVVSNRRIEADSAKLIGKNDGPDDGSVYTEIVLAPSFSQEAVEAFARKQKKKVRLIEAGQPTDFPYDIKMVQGAVLVQEKVDYEKRVDPSKVTFPTSKKADREELAKLLAAWEVVRKVQSNGIVVAEGSFEGGRLSRFWTLGVASFRKRNGAVRIALDNAGERASGAVCASDGFFPFRDSVDLLAEAGVPAVIQPGGSARDADVVAAADEHSMSMAFTHTRAFRH
jgi:phosphoribosylaminoimidazolecarboxamide formyltransferase / IMP cyclohydrolase